MLTFQRENGTTHFDGITNLLHNFMQCLHMLVCKSLLVICSFFFHLALTKWPICFSCEIAALSVFLHSPFAIFISASSVSFNVIALCPNFTNQIKLLPSFPTLSPSKPSVMRTLRYIPHVCLNLWPMWQLASTVECYLVLLSLHKHCLFPMFWTALLVKACCFFKQCAKS